MSAPIPILVTKDQLGLVPVGVDEVGIIVIVHVTQRGHRWPGIRAVKGGDGIAQRQRFPGAGGEVVSSLKEVHCVPIGHHELVVLVVVHVPHAGQAGAGRVGGDLGGGVNVQFHRLPPRAGLAEQQIGFALRAGDAN